MKNCAPTLFTVNDNIVLSKNIDFVIFLWIEHFAVANWIESSWKGCIKLSVFISPASHWSLRKTSLKIASIYSRLLKVHDKANDSQCKLSVFISLSKLL